MKAVVVKAFGDANFVDVDDYPVVEPNEESVLVRIKSAALNPVDYKIRQGMHRFPIHLSMNSTRQTWRRCTSSRIDTWDGFCR
jgi:NADPH:quinone reductase-like Zn-dependent oxidoreductase